MPKRHKATVKVCLRGDREELYPEAGRGENVNLDGRICELSKRALPRSLHITLFLLARQLRYVWETLRGNEREVV